MIVLRIYLSFVIPSCSPDRWLLVVSQYFTSVNLQAVYLKIVYRRLKLLVFCRLLLLRWCHFINMTLAGWDSLNAADFTLCSEMLLMFFDDVHIWVRIWLLLQLMRVLLILRGDWTTLTSFVVSVKVVSTRIIIPIIIIIFVVVIVNYSSVLRARLKWNHLHLVRWLKIVIEVVLKVLLECTVLIYCIGLLVSFRVLSCSTHFNYTVLSLGLVVFPGSARPYSTPTLLSLDRQIVLLYHHQLLVVVSSAVWVCAEAGQVHLGELYVLRCMIEKQYVVGILAIGCLIYITLWKHGMMFEWLIVGQRRQRMIALLILEMLLLIFYSLIRVLVERIAVRLLSDDDVIRILIHFALFLHWYLMLALTY